MTTIRTFTLMLLSAAAMMFAPAAASALNFESAPDSPLGGVGGLANDVATGIDNGFQTISGSPFSSGPGEPRLTAAAIGSFNSDGVPDLAFTTRDTDEVGTSRLVVMLAAPSVAADPQDFGSLRTGKTSTPRTVTVTNDGPLPAEITSVVWGGGDFLEFTSNNLDDCIGTLLPGESCSVDVAFSPSSSGRLTSSLSLYLSGVTAPSEIELTGYSEEKPVKLGFKAAAAKKVKRGKTLAIKVKVRNTFPYPIPALVAKAKVPAKLAKKPKTVKIPALKPGKSVSRTIKAKVKRNAKKGARLKFTVDVRYRNRLVARTRGSSKIK